MDNNKTISALFTFSGSQSGEKSEEWLDFPTTKEKLRQTLERIGGDKMAGCQMSPMFWEDESASPIGGLADLAFDEVSVNELNYLAAILLALDGDDLGKFEAVVESGRYLGSAGVGNGDVADYINIAENLGCFTFHPNFDEAGYGEYLLSGPDNKIITLMTLLRNYYGSEGEALAGYVECLRECADAEQFGQSMAYNNDGEFLDSGYLIEDGGFNAEHYGVLDIPEKYRVWESSDTFIKARMLNYQCFCLKCTPSAATIRRTRGAIFKTS